jgi:hypothetical protein
MRRVKNKCESRRVLFQVMALGSLADAPARSEKEKKKQL